MLGQIIVLCSYQKYNFSELIKNIENKYSKRNYDIDQKDLTIFMESEDYKCKLEIITIDGNYDDENLLKITNFSADIFIKLK